VGCNGVLQPGTILGCGAIVHPGVVFGGYSPAASVVRAPVKLLDISHNSLGMEEPLRV
jgi:hypothetical protein